MDQPDVPFQEAHLVIPESLFDWLSWTVLRLWLRLWCCYCCWFTVKNPGDSQLSEMNEQSVRLPLRTSSLTVPHPNFPSSPMPRCAYHALALAPSTAKVKLCVCSLCSIFRTGVHFTPTITRRSYKHNRKLIRPWERERERDRERERERERPWQCRLSLSGPVLFFLQEVTQYVLFVFYKRLQTEINKIFFYAIEAYPLNTRDCVWRFPAVPYINC